MDWLTTPVSHEKRSGLFYSIASDTKAYYPDPDNIPTQRQVMDRSLCNISWLSIRWLIFIRSIIRKYCGILVISTDPF
jgi:hypothetical protein